MKCFINIVAVAAFCGVLTVIATAIVASIIMWCVIKKMYKHPQSMSGCGMQDDKSGTHELTSVVYDVPVLKDHQNQTISTHDNVAYAGTIALQQNVAYEQVQMKSVVYDVPVLKDHQKQTIMYS